MKKKILAAGLLLCALFMFSACGNEEDVTGTVSESQFSFGESVNNTYKNEFIGVGCTLDSNWEFYSEQEILELCNLTAESFSEAEEMVEALEDTSVITDMVATNNVTMQNINVTLENKGLLGAFVDMDTYISASIANIESAFASAGYTNINAVPGTYEFVGKECACIDISAEASGVTFYEKLVCMDIDNYVVLFTVFSYTEEDIDGVFDSFFALD